MALKIGKMLKKVAKTPRSISKTIKKVSGGATSLVGKVAKGAIKSTVSSLPGANIALSAGKAVVKTAKKKKKAKQVSPVTPVTGGQVIVNDQGQVTKTAIAFTPEGASMPVGNSVEETAEAFDVSRKSFLDSLLAAIGL